MISRSTIWRWKLMTWMESLWSYFSASYGTWIGSVEFKKTQEVHTHNTRTSLNNNFFIPYIKTNTAKRSYSYMGPALWLKIPKILKDLPLFSFKKKYSELLIQNYWFILKNVYLDKCYFIPYEYILVILPCSANIFYVDICNYCLIP